VLVVAALGGNALARRGEPLDAAGQRAQVRVAAGALAELAREHDLVVTHGNGPQVGWLALQAEAAGLSGRVPLDVLGAESEGMIGYWIDQELGNLLPGREIATLLTQVEVAPDDPAFARPSKPIGPVYDPDTARRLAAERGWQVAPEADGRLRRVVPSPEPRAIVELATIRILVRLGVIVVCAGGGGIPVVHDAAGRRGVEAVVDKDLAAALLATRLGADALLSLTDVSAVYRDWPEPARDPIRELRPGDVRGLRLDPGSMGPKLEAARRFATGPGRVAGIGALEDAARILRGEAGTRVRA
jgi:carbamate kinase